ncbi:helix-turn-helix transcriptional regulator [bacterium]|nr:helix-turn-helix transcriptional regulator [bacterium]
MDRKELLGKRIKELRKQKDFTQEYLAEKLKIEPRQLSKLETGKHYPSFETVLGLLETFNITFEELISYEHLNQQTDFKKLIAKDMQDVSDEKASQIYKVIRCLIN